MLAFRLKAEATRMNPRIVCVASAFSRKILEKFRGFRLQAEDLDCQRTVIEAWDEFPRESRAVI